MSRTHDSAWLDGEGDRWFQRNKGALQKKRDMVMFVLDLYGVKPIRAVEIGCANGYRLAEIHKRWKTDVTGIEPSEEAISDGRSRWPFIRFINSMSSSFQMEGTVDLVIANFVFHWISRGSLIKSIERIDSLLKDGGFLIIGDFGTENFIKRRYHHLPEDDLFTYKQQYHHAFTSTGLYREVATLRFNHDTGELDALIDDSNMGTVSLLRKEELYVGSTL
jgi:trans-aconitate methyltransferase